MKIWLDGALQDIGSARVSVLDHGLTVGDVERTIEAAIGGMPVTTTIEGRNRFSVNVRYPQDLRNDLEALKRVLVPVGGGMGAGGGGMGMGEGAAAPSSC